jgi:hypothetical protein
MICIPERTNDLSWRDEWNDDDPWAFWRVRHPVEQVRYRTKMYFSSETSEVTLGVSSLL